MDGYPIKKESNWSTAHHNQDWFDPEMIREQFISLKHCQNDDCGQYVSISGKASPEQTYDDFGQTVWDTMYSPNFVEPAPYFFQIPEHCPVLVKKELEKAFCLFWLDLASCANSLRIAVELLLTELGVKRVYNSKGKRRTYNLHSRIDFYRDDNKQAGDLLEAIKWIGNTGSHAPNFELTREGIIEAFEFFEAAIKLVNNKEERDIQKRAKKVNNRKGRPVKKQRKKS